jgi:hypothetical protein
MHIFVDESGTFSVPATPGTSISAQGALIIPSRKMTYFEKLYGKLRPSLPQKGGEVKGKLLSEAQVRQLINVLTRVGALFEAVVIDLGYHTAEDIQRHKEGQERGFTNTLTNEHQPTLAREVWGLRRQLENFPQQLYVRSVAMKTLVYAVLNFANTYYAFRYPRELAEHRWTIDAKEKGKETDWEIWWKTVILPWIDSRSENDPFMAVEGGDYSSLEWTENEETYLLAPMITKHFRFCSEAEFGLEAVDVLTNAVARSLRGNFARDGWRDIPSLMINRKTQCVAFISLSREDSPPVPYAHVVQDFRYGGRSLLPRWS